MVHGVVSVLEDGSSFVVSTSFFSPGFLSDSFLFCCLRSSQVDNARGIGLSLLWSSLPSVVLSWLRRRPHRELGFEICGSLVSLLLLHSLPMVSNISAWSFPMCGVVSYLWQRVGEVDFSTCICDMLALVGVNFSPKWYGLGVVANLIIFNTRKQRHTERKKYRYVVGITYWRKKSSEITPRKFIFPNPSEISDGILRKWISEETPRTTSSSERSRKIPRKSPSVYSDYLFRGNVRQKFSRVHFLGISKKIIF